MESIHLRVQVNMCAKSKKQKNPSRHTLIYHVHKEGMEMGLWTLTFDHHIQISSSLSWNEICARCDEILSGSSQREVTSTSTFDHQTQISSSKLNVRAKLKKWISSRHSLYIAFRRIGRLWRCKHPMIPCYIFGFSSTEGALTCNRFKKAKIWLLFSSEGWGPETLVSTILIIQLKSQVKL